MPITVTGADYFLLIIISHGFKRRYNQDARTRTQFQIESILPLLALLCGVLHPRRQWQVLHWLQCRKCHLPLLRWENRYRQNGLRWVQAIARGICYHWFIRRLTCCTLRLLQANDQIIFRRRRKTFNNLSKRF